MILLEKLFKKTRGLRRYSAFILEIIIWVAVLLFITPIFAVFLQAQFPKANISFSDFVLLITAAFILAYTYETKKMRQESIYQRKISSAVDIYFYMAGGFYTDKSENLYLGELSTFKGLNCVSRAAFLSGVMTMPISKSGPFYRDSMDSENLVAKYYINCDKDRKDFLRALQLQNGEIRASVLMTNGERFIYTFRAVQDNWKKATKREGEGKDEFILVKKELDED